MRIPPMAQQLIVAQKGLGSSERTIPNRARVPERVSLMLLRMARQVGRTAKGAAAVGMGADETSRADRGWRSNRVVAPRVGLERRHPRSSTRARSDDVVDDWGRRVGRIPAIVNVGGSASVVPERSIELISVPSVGICGDICREHVVAIASRYSVSITRARSDDIVHGRGRSVGSMPVIANAGSGASIVPEGSTKLISVSSVAICGDICCEHVIAIAGRYPVSITRARSGNVVHGRGRRGVGVRSVDRIPVIINVGGGASIVAQGCTELISVPSVNFCGDSVIEQAVAIAIGWSITSVGVIDHGVRNEQGAKVVPKGLGAWKRDSASRAQAGSGVSIIKKKKTYPPSAAANPCIVHESCCELGTRLVPWYAISKARARATRWPSGAY